MSDDKDDKKDETKDDNEQAPEERLLDLNAVMRRVPACRSTIYEWIRAGQFPAGRRVGPRKRLWKQSEIELFLNQL